MYEFILSEDKKRLDFKGIRRIYKNEKYIIGFKEGEIGYNSMKKVIAYVKWINKAHHENLLEIIENNEEYKELPYNRRDEYSRIIEIPESIPANLIENFFLLEGLRNISLNTYNNALGTLPISNVHCTFRNYIPETESQKEAFDASIEFCNSNEQQKGLIIYGPPGTGKSHLATAILKDHGFSNKNLIPTYRTDDFKKIKEYTNHQYNILIDDLETRGDPRNKLLEELVRRIETKGGSFVITTNLEEYETMFKKKIYDRTCMFTTAIEVKGKSREERYGGSGMNSLKLKKTKSEIEELKREVRDLKTQVQQLQNK